MTVLFWILFCILVGVLASNNGRSGILWGLTAAICSPLVAGIVLLILILASPRK